MLITKAVSCVWGGRSNGDVDSLRVILRLPSVER